MPLLVAPSAVPAGAQVASGVGSVAASITGGIALGGAVIGIFAGIATVITLVIFAAVTIKKGRRDYEQEIRAAEQRGRDDRQPEIDAQRQWTEHYKSLAQDRLHLPPEAMRPEEERL